MSLNIGLIGRLAAELMDDLPEEAGEGELVAVGLVVVVDNGDTTYTRIKTSPDGRWAGLGIFGDAIETVLDGYAVNDD